MYRQLFNNYGKLILVTVVVVAIFLLLNLSTTVVVEVLTTSFARNQSRKIYVRPRTVKVEKSSLQREFNVFNLKCRIPRVDPFAADAMRLFKPSKFKKCKEQPDLFAVSYDTKKRQYILNVNKTLLLFLYPDVSSFSCVYHQIARVNNGTGTRIFTPITFEQSILIPRFIIGIIVECHDLQNKSRILQRDAFALAQNPKDRNDQADGERSREHPSIIMLGIDSMSQINFRRTMPLTSMFVRQSGWYEMLGYNKIGDNTLPNMLALLTGGTPHHWKTFCNITNPGCLDAITFIWSNYQNAGYLTAFAEDLPTIETFNYRLPGFMQEPVNFYLRPFMTTITPYLDKVIKFGYNYCVGRRQSYRYIFDYCRQLVQRFIQETPKPLFGLFLTNSFSHDDFSGPASVDADIVGYLEQYKELGLFERAIVILFSDHGQRQGPLMELPSSFLEERLPMLHIYLPPWYHQQHPNIARALDKNRRRLSTPYDVFKTLQNVLELSHPGLTFEAKPYCVDCQSLFKTLPKHRDCENACIFEHWCTCKPYIHVPNNQTMNYLAKLIIYRINQFVTSQNLNKFCTRLTLDKLLKVERKEHMDEKGLERPPPTGVETYRLKFITHPNKALYRATIWVSNKTKYVDIKDEFITRLNTYRNDSLCVKSHRAKKYCVCFNAQDTYDDYDEILDLEY